MEADLEKILPVPRPSFELLGTKFSFLGPNGMNWCGDCRSLVIDYELDLYEIAGTITTGPTEWVGLPVVIYGQCDDSDLSIEPEAMYRSRLADSAAFNKFIADRLSDQP